MNHLGPLPEGQNHREPLLDAVTGLPRREAFLNELDFLIEHYVGRFGLVFADIDGLKAKNDTEGHSAGDQLLYDFSKVASETLRLWEHEEGAQEANLTLVTENRRKSEDEHSDNIYFLARLAGDEFTLLLPGITTQDDVNAVIKRLDHNLLENGIRASMGGRPHKAGESAQELIDAADEMMYDLKHKRKAQEAARLEAERKALAAARIASMPWHARKAYGIGQQLIRYADRKASPLE